jgi:hypothetical protein
MLRRRGQAVLQTLGKHQGLVVLAVLLVLTGIDPAVRPFTFPPIQPVNPQTPPRLEALIMWMVQLDESRRPQDIVVIRHELDLITHPPSMPQPAMPVQPSPPVYSVPLYTVPPTTLYLLGIPVVPLPIGKLEPVISGSSAQSEPCWRSVVWW